MHPQLKKLTICLALACLLGGAPALAQDAPSASGSGSGADRLILGFAEEAAVVDQQWWEGQLVRFDGDGFDAWIVRGVVAFQLLQDFEVGGSVGFGSSDTRGVLPDGSGATDLDVWGKFHFAGRGENGFALGGKLTLPTGDDTAGLGFDAVSFEAFGSLRHALENALVNIAAGVQLNGDGQVFGVDIMGETSPFVSAGVIFPMNDGLSIVGEAVARGERFQGLDSDARIFGGINWSPGGRGIVRAGLSFGLTDGAPDYELLGGWAVNF